MSRVCVVGLGKLGACLAALLAARHHRVIGLDVVPFPVDKINNGASPVSETGLTQLITEVHPRLRATTSPSQAVFNSDIALIVVPTPSGDDGTFTNKYVLEAVEMLGKELRGRSNPYTVVICSTVMPGSCAGPIKEKLEETSGRTVGDNLGLAYSPEFIALGSVLKDMANPDMVLVGADDPVSRQAAVNVLKTLPENQPEIVHLSLVDAEIAKLAVNTYVTMKISFANTLGEICEQIPGANATLVANAIGTDSRIGSKYLRPGGAYGGPCFPRDNVAFAKLAHSVGVTADLAMATDEINRRQVFRLFERIAHLEEVSVLGVAYKPGTPVMEASFGRQLVELLQFEGIRVFTFDPKARETINGNNACSEAQECVDSTDTVVIATPDPAFADLRYKGKTVIDMWGLVDPQAECGHLVRFGVGR